MSADRIGIDLGGTKIEGAVLGADGRVLGRVRRPTPSDDYQATLTALVEIVAELESDRTAKLSVGIGTPGAVSPGSGLMKNANSVCLNGRSLGKDVERLLDRPVRVANDADCFALSEVVDGAASGARSAFGVILGTGVGGGVVIEGRLLSGPNAIAGEWGHNSLPRPRAGEWPGPTCYCGREGCIETFLSGPGLARDFEEATGTRVRTEEIAARANAGDELAEDALQRYEDRLARALSSVINVLDPEVVVLGGGLSNLERLYERVPRLWHTYVFSDTVRTRLVPPVHGDSGGVRGAAWLWSPGEVA
jgi:fructokinase